MNDVFDVVGQIQVLAELKSSEGLFAEKCVELAEAVGLGEAKALDVVTHLGDLLVSPTAERRAHGTAILSATLDALASSRSDSLGADELFFLAGFYADRLRDNQLVIPAALAGVRALALMRNADERVVRLLLVALFDNVPCQQQRPDDRRRIYEAFVRLFERDSTRREIERMGTDFVIGLISAMDGERDPRNLLLLFGWLPAVLARLPLGHLADEMFDVVSCYFPVDFRVPPPPACSNDDGPSITRDALADALNRCLCAAPEFDAPCLPLLIEKLDSALRIAKLDSLHLLTHSCKTFGPAVYEAHAAQLWSCLRREALGSTDDQVRTASLAAATAVSSRLSSSLSSFIADAHASLESDLLDPNSKLFSRSARLMLALARGSPECRACVARLTVPPWLARYGQEGSDDEREALLDVLVRFALLGNGDGSDPLANVPALCVQATSSKALKRTAFEHVSSLLDADLLTRERDRIAARNALAHELTAEPKTTDGERAAMLDCLTAFFRRYGHEALSIVTAADRDDDGDVHNTDIGVLDLQLEALRALIVTAADGSDPQLTNEMLPHLLDMCTGQNRNHRKTSVAIGHLRQLIERAQQHLLHILHKEYNVVVRLVSWITSNLHILANHTVQFESKSDQQLVEDTSLICRTIMGQLDIGEQQKIVDTLVPQLIHLISTHASISIFVALLAGIVTRLRRNVQLPNKCALVEQLIITDHQSNENASTCNVHACHIAASIVNKSEDDDELRRLLSEIERCANESKDFRNVLLLRVWLTKALVLRGSVHADAWTDKLLALLDVHENVAKSFELIMREDREWLCAESHCNIRFLYRQKFFAYVMKKLSDDNQDGKTSKRRLVAAGYLVRAAPQPIVRMYFKETFRLMARCLRECSDAGALRGVLETVLALLRTDESSSSPSLDAHVGDLLPRLLELASFPDCMKVRMAAVNCIEEMANRTTCPLHVLLPHRVDVLTGLAKCLDDPKRLVRRQAVRARSVWFLVGASI